MHLDDFFKSASKPSSAAPTPGKAAVPPPLDDDIFGDPAPKKETPSAPTVAPSLDDDIFGDPAPKKEAPSATIATPSFDDDFFGAPAPKTETPKKTETSSKPATPAATSTGPKAEDIFGFKPADPSSLFADDGDDDLFG